MRPPCVRTLGSDLNETLSAGPLGSTRLFVPDNKIDSLADLAPTAEAPLLPYDEAIEWVAERFGVIDFGFDRVIIKLPGGQVERATVPECVQVLETLERYDVRLKDLRHELAEIEARRQKLLS